MVLQFVDNAVFDIVGLLQSHIAVKDEVKVNGRCPLDAENRQAVKAFYGGMSHDNTGQLIFHDLALWNIERSKSNPV